MKNLDYYKLISNECTLTETHNITDGLTLKVRSNIMGQHISDTIVKEYKFDLINYKNAIMIFQWLLTLTVSKSLYNFIQYKDDKYSFYNKLIEFIPVSNRYTLDHISFIDNISLMAIIDGKEYNITKKGS